MSGADVPAPDIRESLLYSSPALMSVSIAISTKASTLTDSQFVGLITWVNKKIA